MLTVQHLKYEYQQEQFQFDLTVKSGAIMALMGASGAGKSTLLALLAGFIEPESGSIEVEQRRMNGLPPHQRPFAFLFQEHNLFAHLTARDNIALGLNSGLKLTEPQWQQVEQAAAMVGVQSYLQRLPEQLSGGQRQRVALARCFVQSHPIWLLDEPFSALDPLLREEMLQLVKRLAAERNITLLMVTHHLSDAKAIASDFAFMRQGRIEVTGPIRELTAQHCCPALAQFVAAGQ